MVDVDTGESKTVYMPKALIEEALEEAEYWDPNRKEELVKTVFTEAMKKALKDNSSKTYTNFNDYCIVVANKGIEELNPTELAGVLDKFSEAAYDSLRYECTKKIAKAKQDDANTYANTLVSLFTTYCNYLTEANNVFTSPLRSQYEIYANIYAFQGELKCKTIYTEDGVDYIDETNLASLAREKYFIELNKIGTYVAEIANASGAYTTEDLHDSIYMPWSTAEAALNQTYNDFYHVDVNGNEIDNFCYVTDSVLKYGINNVECSVEIGFTTHETTGIGGHVYVESLTRRISKDWTTSINNDNILTNNQLLKIYAYFVSNVGKRSGINFNFYEYLYNYKVCDTLVDETYDKSPLFITGFNGGTDLGSNDKITMLVWPFYKDLNEKYVRQSCGATYEKVFDNGYDAFYKELISGATGEMVVKRKAMANTFNPLTGEADTNTNVGTVAIHFHDYKHQDDIALLVDGEYMPTKYMFKNPYDGLNDTAFNYNINAATKWMKKWYGQATEHGSEIMRTFNYSRPYGSIITNDVNVYMTNGKISKTNSIEVVQNNIIPLSNNYIKNVSFTDDNYLINNAIKEDVSPSFVNTVNTTREKFINLLETLYPNKPEDIERLKNNKVFSVSFNNDNCVNVDVETYKAAVLKLIDYLKPDDKGNNDNINSMISDFRNLYSEINKTIDVLKTENNEAKIVLSDSDYDKLIRTIIAENLDNEFSVCERIRDIPSKQDKLFIYCEEDGEIYVWNNNHYDKYSNVKQAYTYVKVPDGTVVVSDGIYTSDTVPNDFHGDYIYNSLDRKYYKWNEVKIPEHYGEYKEITKIKAVNSIPSEKTTDYLYSLSNKKVYEWKKELELKYVKVDDVKEVVDLESYVGQVVKNTNVYYKWATTTEIDDETLEEIVVDKYVPVKIVEVLPETMDEQYLVCAGACYKWLTNETSEKYVEIEKVPQVGDIVKVGSMPNTYRAKFILYNDTFYRFEEKPYDGDTSKYILADENIKKPDDFKIITEPTNPVEVNIYPSTSSKQLKLVYEVKPTISFELFFDKEIKNVSDVKSANIGYNVIPYFDITPMLTWKDANGNQKYLSISDDVLKNADIGPIAIKIPVIQMNNEKDTNALIYHFDSMENTSCPIDEYNSRIMSDNGGKYVIISSNSFSPFMVKRTYSVFDPSKKYVVPNTGILK